VNRFKLCVCKLCILFSHEKEMNGVHTPRNTAWKEGKSARRTDVELQSAKLGVAYVAAQLAGGVLGAAAAFYSLPKGMQTLAHAGTQAVPAGSSVPQVGLAQPP